MSYVTFDIWPEVLKKHKPPIYIHPFQSTLNSNPNNFTPLNTSIKNFPKIPLTTHKNSPKGFQSVGHFGLNIPNKTPTIINPKFSSDLETFRLQFILQSRKHLLNLVVLHNDRCKETLKLLALNKFDLDKENTQNTSASPNNLQTVLDATLARLDAKIDPVIESTKVIESAVNNLSVRVDNQERRSYAMENYIVAQNSGMIQYQSPFPPPFPQNQITMQQPPTESSTQPPQASQVNQTSSSSSSSHSNDNTYMMEYPPIGPARPVTYLQMFDRTQKQVRTPGGHKPTEDEKKKYEETIDNLKKELAEMKERMEYNPSRGRGGRGRGIGHGVGYRR